MSWPGLSNLPVAKRVSCLSEIVCWILKKRPLILEKILSAFIWSKILTPTLTQLFAQKVDIKIISELLGHSSVQITYDTYVHILEE